MNPVTLKRTTRKHSGWGIDLRWSNHTAQLSYALEVRGCWLVTGWTGFSLYCIDSRNGLQTAFLYNWSVGDEPLRSLHSWFRAPNDWWLRHPVDMNPFWAACREARRSKTGEPVVDWLHEFGPSLIVTLLEQGVPECREVWAAGVG